MRCAHNPFPFISPPLDQRIIIDCASNGRVVPVYAVSFNSCSFIMATRGVMQLTKLQLVYCEYGGSSAAVRDYISSGKIIDWARQSFACARFVQVQNGKHPLIRGEYKTGFPKQISVRNESIHRIETVMDMLHNSSGRKMTQLKKPVITATPSVQGVWTPMLNLQDKQFKVTIHED